MKDSHDGKVIINFAPTGMIPTRKMTPLAPLSVSEIVEDVHRAWEIGITMVHIHARDAVTEVPTSDPEVYQRIIEGIRAITKELIVCVSLSGRNCTEFERRAAPLSIDGQNKPDMGSLTLSSLNFNRQASVNEPDVIKKLAAEMQNRGIAPELEAFDAGMINYANYLIGKGLIRPPYYFNLILGNIACAQADLLHAGIMVRDLPDNSYWSLAGIGAAQLQMNSVAIAMGGGVRVGLEDNIWFDKDRTKLASNEELIKRVHVVAEANERPVMPASELRERLGLGAGIDGRFGLAV